jgi:Tfp pilus assembly protein PilX
MADDKTPDEVQEFHPKGAALFVVIFILILIALWGTVYLMLLSRGVTI